MRHLLSQFAIGLTLGVILYHRWKARPRGERLDRTPEGFWDALLLRFFMLVFTFETIAWAVMPRPLLPVPLSAWLQSAGVGLCFVTAGLYAWTLRSLGANLSDTITTRRQHELVTAGPYRWVRHPFYSCSMLFVLCVFLMSKDVYLLLLGGVMVTFLVRRCQVEEMMLGWRFRSPYWEYRNRTGAFFPRWRL